MTVSQSLFRFRRYRSRDADENDNPAPLSSGDAGGDDESPPGNNVDGTSETERRGISSEVDSNSNDHGTISTLPGMNDDHASNAISPPTDDEEHEMVVRIPHGHPSNYGGPDAAPPSFVLPAIAWEPTEESAALRRESILREVRRVQRANFVHFLVLCLVPTTLLLIVVAAILG
eukprot:CAMPEP_0172528072 /NCGR_PEP_ID=MMETSP1067-20121228/2584_1 /TAXON_ID=265564 ORGANISM="Thalassiosira punctigera, Strain Tpunct2005C2" /NCGR_SAMPLE_ID=MMETSP1067 /ASSEMBLY_ACC=CAM_ASM_000444 /LENGTH=173 /DNA_ID=CAMNT_0013311931 /DNA_START=29 /DNA_END=547 /DNA_ORIENTATION=-